MFTRKNWELRKRAIIKLADFYPAVVIKTFNASVAGSTVFAVLLNLWLQSSLIRFGFLFSYLDQKIQNAFAKWQHRGSTQYD